jgi:hypothetical protein
VVQQIVYWAWIIEMLFLFNLKIRRLAYRKKSKIINHMFVHSKIEFSRRKHSFIPRKFRIY